MCGPGRVSGVHVARRYSYQSQGTLPITQALEISAMITSPTYLAQEVGTGGCSDRLFRDCRPFLIIASKKLVAGLKVVVIDKNLTCKTPPNDSFLYLCAEHSAQVSQVPGEGGVRCVLSFLLVHMHAAVNKIAYFSHSNKK